MRNTSRLAAPQRIAMPPALAGETTRWRMVAPPHAAVAKPWFDAHEKLAIRIGFRDPMATESTMARLAGRWKNVFGIRRPLPFADPKLEALRQLILALRRRSPHLGRAAAVARQAGVSREQIAYLVQE